MQINIPMLLQDILQSGKNVCIPGIGSIILEHQSAQLNFKDKQINPPLFTSSFFTQELSNCVDLSDAIQERYTVSQSQSKKILARFREDFTQYIAENNQLNITGIGTFSQKGDSVQFDALDGQQSGYVYGLPMSTLQYVATDSEVAEKQNKRDEVGKKESWMPMFVTIASCIVIILAFWFVDNRWNNTSDDIISSNENQHIRKSRFNASPSFDSVFTAEDTAKDEEEETNAIGNKATMDSSTNAEITFDDTIANQAEEKLANEENAIEKEALKQADPIEESSNKSDLIPDIEQLEENCVIVVGAFGSERNVARMQEKLSKRFGKVHLSKAGRLTRVGVYSSCDRERLNEVLHICKTEFEEKSWIYIDH